MLGLTSRMIFILGLAVSLAVTDTRKPIVIDCDGVSDDVRAMILALQNPQIEVVTGPLTNVALALRMEPKFAGWPTQMIVMGGNFRGKHNVELPLSALALGVGNVEQTTAESNFYTDPEAAYVVLKNMKCPVTLVTWEACLFAGVKHPVDFYGHLRLNTPLSKFLVMATRAPRAHIANITNPTFPQYFYCDEITIGMVVDAKRTAIDLQTHRASVELREDK
ncbi:Protein Y43F8C.13 [Aphelenchoides avenae]|nr:Protein Y43F8C.13 [Aphelenchus avenae]